MREIKFRALRRGKTWWYSSDEGIYFKDGCLYEFDDIDDINIGIAYQYIRVKDKNKKEIYDGDIVKDSSNRLMKVEWDNRLGTSRFIFKTINKVGHIQSGRLLNTHEWITSDDNDIEIIGNIYENPELLEA